MGAGISYPNTYKGGTIHHDAKGVFLTSAGDIRDLAVNEQVYVLKVEVKDTAVLIGIQTCGTCNPTLPDPENVPSRANITFQFGKPYLASATAAQVEEVIGHVLAPGQPGNASPQPVSNAAPPTPPTQPTAPPAPTQPMAPIAPPPPPPDTPAAAPVEVKIGQTTEQVTAALGQPLQIFNLGSKVIYKYQSLKVTFVNGKVSDVE
jgi:hypothetical protein